MRPTFPLALLILSFTLAAHADDSPAIVSGKGVRVTVADVQAAIAQQSASLRARYRDAAMLRGLVDELVRQQLLANEADKRGYQRDPAVLHTVDDSAAQALVRNEVDDKVAPQDIPPADLAAYYDAHPAEFHRPAMRRVAVIVLDKPEDAERLLPEAIKADARGFGELAKQHSRDPRSKVEAGDLGYFTLEATPALGEDTQKVPTSVRSAAFALPGIGVVSPAPVAFDKQVAIVRLSSERPERNVTLADATSSIRAKLWRERRQKALDTLVGGLRMQEKPQVHTDRIYAIDFEDMERRPGGFAPDPAPSPAKTP